MLINSPSLFNEDKPKEKDNDIGRTLIYQSAEDSQLVEVYLEPWRLDRCEWHFRFFIDMQQAYIVQTCYDAKKYIDMFADNIKDMIKHNPDVIPIMPHFANFDRKATNEEFLQIIDSINKFISNHDKKIRRVMNSVYADIFSIKNTGSSSDSFDDIVSKTEEISKEEKAAKINSSATIWAAIIGGTAVVISAFFYFLADK